MRRSTPSSRTLSLAPLLLVAVAMGGASGCSGTTPASGATETTGGEPADSTADPTIATGSSGAVDPSSTASTDGHGDASESSGDTTGSEPPAMPSQCDEPLALPATMHVSPRGDDGSGDGSEASPWRSLGWAIAQMQAGDVLVLDDGVYDDQAIADVPPGDDGFTVIMARHPMQVRVTGGSGLLHLTDRVHVDGIIFDGGPGGESVGVIEGAHNRVTRSMFRRHGESGEQGSLLAIYGDDNLVEDVAGVGSCRACFIQGGPDAHTQRNIWRRVVVRMDYTSSPLPKSAFNTYGNNDDDSVRDHLYQNVIAIDGAAPDTGGEGKYGAIYVAKNASGVRFQGILVLDEQVTHAGIFGTEWGDDNAVEHSVVWGISDGAVGVRASAAHHVTIGGFTGTAAALDAGDPLDSSLDQELTLLLDNTPGARLLERYGASGSHWGEPGFDQPTGEPLWPWPCEAEIAALFAEPNDPPPGNAPAHNPTARGFAAGGVGLYGGPVTLTSHVWERLGTPCPTDICPR